MKRYALLTTIAIVAIGMVMFWLARWEPFIDSGFWQRVEGTLIDHRYISRGERLADTNIVLVGIEASSLTLDALSEEEIAASPTLQKMREPYPWDRSVYADVLEKLVAAGAKVVVFDFVFFGTKQGDDKLAKALEKHRNRVVIGSMFEGNEERYLSPEDALLPPDSEGMIGLVNVWPESDGIVRRGRYKTSAAREHPELKKFADQYPDNLIHMSARAVEKFAGKVDLPPYERDNFIDFQGERDTYLSVPIEKLFVETLWKAPPLNNGALFRDKIVVVGPIANVFHDIHQTPFRDIPGPEVQCQMIAALLNRSWLEEPSPKYNTMLTLGMVALGLAICLLVTNAAYKPVLMAGMLLGFFAVCHYAFTRAGVVVSMTPPLFGFLSTGILGTALQFFLEQIERRRYRTFLNRYVSKNVADLIIADRRSFEESKRGQRKPVAILFSDIRGFTGMTEENSPEQLVAHLNEYLIPMVDLVEGAKGTLSKFIGDAIMAVWGDVLTAGPKEDARQAVKTALEMRAEVAKLNEHWVTQADRSPIQIGIGVNFGESIVGNIGSQEKAEFAVLGDTVNLAARLETATKQFKVDLLVGETVEELTREHFVFRKVGLLTVKGKVKPVEAYAVLGERSAEQPEPPWLGRYHEAIEMFRNRDFDAAGELFKIVQADIGEQDFLCKMYIESCARYAHMPPPENWAGNFVLTEK